MMWTLKERVYLAVGFLAAALSAYGALQLSRAIGLFDTMDSAPLAIGVAVFTTVLAVMIKAVEAIRDERTRREMEELFHQNNSN
jgi:mannose/fructose/N-acetylgalactosamine-specific phosphotransferase system component IIC